ncbi:hypothetical protein ACJX0J_001291 (mitochondrion) [Zea mays]
MARSFFLSITSGWSRMHKTDMGTGVEAPASPFPLSPGTDRLEYSQVKKKKIYILILFLGGILRIGKRCGFLCSDSKRRAKHIPVGPSSFFHEGQSEEELAHGLKPMAFLYSKIKKGNRKKNGIILVVFLMRAIEKLLFFPLSRTSSDPFVRNFFEKKAYDEHLLDGNALQSSALLTGLFGERRKRRSLAEEDKTICF